MKTTIGIICSIAVLVCASTVTARPTTRAPRGTADSTVVPVATNAARSSANYTVSAEIVNGGGGTSTSAMYSQTASLGGITGTSTVASPAEVSNAGFLGQIYNVVSFYVYALPSNNIPEGSTRQLSALQMLDDSTNLAVDPSATTWSVTNGPLTSISRSGLATAGIVYQSTTATVVASYANRSITATFGVSNVNTDDYGSYAGDGIDDAWQVQYFGFDNPLAGPNVDVDGTGQTNLFKYIAGLNPLDPTSRFVLKAVEVPGHPDQKNLIFSPIVAGRIYTVMATTDLGSPTWAPITASVSSDNGNERTTTDLAATGARRFYRVQITLP